MSASARRKIVEQYQTIEQLQAKVAELEAEVERTNDAFEQEHKACHDLIEKVIPNINKQLLSAQAENARLKAAVEYAETIRVENIAYFEKQLAISQLRETQLRKDLEAVIKVHGYKSGIPVEAISTQTSTEALDKYVAEKVKELSDEQYVYIGEGE